MKQSDESCACGSCVCKVGPTRIPCLSVNCSQQLRDADEVRLLQIFESGEHSVEILRQVEHFLRNFDDFILELPLGRKRALAHLHVLLPQHE